MDLIMIMSILSRLVILRFIMSKCLTYSLMNQEIQLVGQESLFRMMQKERFMWKDSQCIQLRMKKRPWIFYSKERQRKLLLPPKWMKIVAELTVYIQSMYSVSLECNQLRKLSAPSFIWSTWLVTRELRN